MGKKTVYTIVTNDYEEETVAIVTGAKKAAEYMNLTESAFLKRVCRNAWGKLKHRAIIDETIQLKKRTRKQRNAYQEKYYATHDRSEYARLRYEKRKEVAKMLKPIYESNKEFKEYVDKYAKTREIPVDTALKHKTVEEAAKYYEKKYEGVVRNG